MSYTLKGARNSLSRQRLSKNKEVSRKLQFQGSEEAHKVSESQIREAGPRTPTEPLGLYSVGL